jgi:hypothetical protein
MDFNDIGGMPIGAFQRWISPPRDRLDSHRSLTLYVQHHSHLLQRVRSEAMFLADHGTRAGASALSQ